MEMMLMMNTAKLGNRMSREGIFYLAGRNPGGGRGGKSIVLPSDLEQNDIWGSLSKMLFDFCFEILVNPLQAQTCFFLLETLVCNGETLFQLQCWKEKSRKKEFSCRQPCKDHNFQNILKEEEEKNDSCSLQACQGKHFQHHICSHLKLCMLGLCLK